MPQTTQSSIDTLHALTEEDQQILASMVAADGETSFEIRPGVSSDDILKNLYVATRAAVALDHRRDKLLHVIGRILHVIKNNPAIYTDRGFKSFDQFLKKHVTGSLGLGKTTLQTAVRIYEAFPTVSPATVAEVGTVKMNLLTKATNFTQPGHVQMIEDAKTMSTSQVIQMVAEKGAMSVGEILRTVITIPCSKNVAKMWREFVADPRVVAYCQTEDPGLILEYLMGECLNEWTNRAVEPVIIQHVPEGVHFPI